jgi:uncharacterized protein (DUF952 family)/uncharacterized protein (UPF0335 family)
MESDLHIIYHLTPADYFNSLPADQPYRPREFDRDGFIHCTKGEERMLLVADTVYRRVPGDFLLLVIDEHKVTLPVKYENVGGILFPHIYGPLNRNAITRVVTIGRRQDGTFLPIGEPDPTADKAAVTEAWLFQARVEQLLAESTDLRARTIERLTRLEREISNLKSQISKQAARPLASTPPAPAVTVETAAPAPAPTLESRVSKLEQEIAGLKLQISNLKSQAPKTRPRKTLARKSPTKRR